MNEDTAQPTGWDLHLRQARGEQLSEVEQRQYDAEMARHVQAAPLPSDLETLQQMRATVASLTQENTQLRARIERLEQEIRIAERSLSLQTRDLLGVRD